MNGMFNNNFLIGMLLARDLPRQEQFLTGLVAGQMPADSPVAPLLLQPIVNRAAAAERGRTTAESEATTLRRVIEIELPDSAETATLRMPGATGARFSRVEGSPGTTVDGNTGVVALPSRKSEATVAITLNGSVRQVVILRGPRASVEQNAERSFTDAQLASIGRALVAALQGTVGAGDGGSFEDRAADNEVTGAADQAPTAPAAPAAAPKERPSQRRPETYTAPQPAGKPADAR